MKLRHKVNIALYNLILRGLNANTSVTKRILGKRLFGRIINFDFDRTFDSNFPKKEEFRFIQIGGNDGISFDGLYRKIIVREKKHGIILEPSPKYFKLLEANYKNFPGVKLLPYAIFENSGTLELFELNENGLKNHPKWAAGIGSIDINHLLNLHVKPEEILKIEVEGITFAELLKMNSGFNCIDYLQIDTEGYDFQILRTIDFGKFDAKAIKFEFKNLSPLEQEQAIVLLGNNYEIYRDDMDMICLKRGMKVKCRL
jgi:FkbM family methyltransferase